MRKAKSGTWKAHPPIEQHGNLIKIGHVDDHEMEHNVSISYEIVVPTETRLRSNTGSGEQSINGLRGPVEASSGSGHLRLTNIGDAVRASTGSGHITVDGVKGEVHASTGSGADPGHRRGGRPARLDGQRQRHAAADRARRCGGEHRLRHARNSKAFTGTCEPRPRAETSWWKGKAGNPGGSPPLPATSRCACPASKASRSGPTRFPAAFILNER